MYSVFLADAAELYILAAVIHQQYLSGMLAPSLSLINSWVNMIVAFLFAVHA